MKRTLLLGVIAALAASAQVAEKANENYKTKEGRSSVAAGLTGPARDARQKPKELVATLEIQPGMTVADVGTGAGYMLPHLSAAVGPGGRIFAQDVHNDFLDRAKESAKELKNVTFVLGDAKSTNLPSGSADLILLLDVYHHLDYPEASLRDLRRALKPEGRLAIVEYHKNEHAMPNGRALQHVRLSEEDAIKEIEANGFRLVTRKEHVPRVQWVGIFRVKE